MSDVPVALQSRLEEIHRRQNALNARFLNLSASEADALAYQVQLAFTWLLQLAISIRGDYDNKPTDNTQRLNLLKQLDDAFGRVQKEAETQVADWGKVHSEVRIPIYIPLTSLISMIEC